MTFHATAGGSALGLKQGSHVDFNLAAGHDSEKDLIDICSRSGMQELRIQCGNGLLIRSLRSHDPVDGSGDCAADDPSWITTVWI